MARTVGLDLGSYSIKAMVLETGARGARQPSFFDVPRPEGEPLETLKAALREVLALHPVPTDNAIVALPSAALAMHTLTLPFADPKRIEAALPFELESQLPFELSEAIYDYQQTGRRDAGATLLAGVVRKEELEALLQALAELEVDPRIVTHPALAYHNLFVFAPQSFGEPAPEEGPPTEGPIALVDLGHERTCLAVGRPGAGVEWARTFAGGGKELTRALAAEFQSPIPEANAWKEAHGTIGPAAEGPDAQRASAAFQRGMQGILRELRATLKAYSAQSRTPVGRVVICGGTSRMPGMAEQLSVDLGLPVTLISLPQEVEAVVPSNDHPMVAQSYALALRGIATGAKAPRFNLRRGEFAFRRDSDSMRDQLLRVGVFTAVLAALFIVFTITRSTLLSRREQDVDKQLCAVTERVLGRCEANYDRALNLLQGKESPAAAIPARSAVGLLAELNDRIPPDLPVTFNQLDIDLERLQLRGETESPRQVDSLARALKTSPCFKEVKEGKVEKSRDGSGVSFRLDVQVHCPEAEAKP